MLMPRFKFDGGLEISAPEAPQQGLRARTIGYRWVASRGKDACPQCAALHDKEFYYEPKPGQASVEEMPKGQLHPNCRCTQKPLSDLENKIRLFNPEIKSYMEGKVEHGFLGFLFRKDSLNSLGDAPIYGRY